VWCAVRTRRSLVPGLCVLALAGAGVGACQFEPTGAAGPAGDDGVGGGGSDGGGGIQPDAQPRKPDAEAGPVTCVPNETVCDGRTLSQCNASGDGFTERRVCPFTCEDDDHCTLASNVPEAEQEDCPGSAVRLAPPPGADVTIVNQGDGLIECDPNCGDGISSIPAAGTENSGDLNMVWFCLAEIDIPSDVTVTVEAGLPRTLGLLVRGEARVAGQILAAGNGATIEGPGAAGPGGGIGGGLVADQGQAGGGACPGQGGGKAELGLASTGGGGGGGGHGGNGGVGGAGRSSGGQTADGGGSGPGCGVEALEPLVAGGGGGSGGDGSCQGSCGWPGGGGGGGIQIAAGGGVTITGTIDASGGDGFGVATGDEGRGGGGGGGAGGAILLEGPSVTVSGGGRLLVEGGAGGAALAGNGGIGGAAGLPTGAGGANADANSEGGSGGGGGGGRIRLNGTAVPACGAFASPDGVCRSGGLKQGGSIGGQSSSAPR
jgi:hypothetical protein